MFEEFWILGDPPTSVTSVMSYSVTLWTAAFQAPLSVGFSGQEFWSQLPCPPPGHLLDPGTEPAFLTSNLHWQAGPSPLVPPEKN